MSMRVCIIGAGVSGLTVAYLLKKKGFAVSVFEASERTGGNIQTESVDGFLVESGPNSLLRSPRLIDLIDLLDLRSRVLPADPSAKNRYIVIDGALEPVPMSMSSLISSNLFSNRAKLRLLKEPFVRSKALAGESVADFFSRRLGDEIVAKAVDPFISGIYAGDIQKLSIAAAFPRLFEFERQHGSLLVGSLRSKSEKPDKKFPRTFTFPGGMQELINRLTDEIGDDVKRRSPVGDIARGAAGRLRVRSNDEVDEFDAVVISTPADASADLIENFDQDLAQRFRAIRYPSVAVVRSGYRADDLGRRPDGFGFLVPRTEALPILGSIWNSSAFPGRAPAGYHLFTTFIGGARRPDLFDQSDESLFQLAHESISKIMSCKGAPVVQSLVRWPRAIPQYEAGHVQTTAAARKFEGTMPGLYFCSNFLGGISVGDCVKNAFATADRIADSVRG